MEYLLCTYKNGDFKIIHRVAKRHRKVGVCILNPDKIHELTATDDLAFISSQSVTIPMDVSYFTMNKMAEVESTLQSLYDYLCLQYEVYKQLEILN